MPTQQRIGAAVAGFAAATLTAVSFVDWFTLPARESAVRDSAAGATRGLDMWQAFSVADLVAGAAIAVGLTLAVAALIRRATATTMALCSVAVLSGLIAALLLGWGLKDPAPMTREPVAYAGVLAAVGIAAGGYLGLREDWLRPRAQRRKGDEGGVPRMAR